MQHSDAGTEKARRLSRPVSSFAKRDLTLNEVYPSILGDNTHQQDLQCSEPVEGHPMKISAPRRVYSTFRGANDMGTDLSSTFFDTSSAVGDTKDHEEIFNGQAAPTGGASAGMAPFDDPFCTSTGRLRVQFDNSRNEVTEYSPSSQNSPINTLTSAWHSVPSLPSEQGSEMLEGANPISGERPDISPVPPSRCASNLALRAGTFDELVDDLSFSKYTGGTQRTAPLEHCTSASFLSIRTNSGIPANGDVQISRRASNMTNRAGTFDELISNSQPVLPAASAALTDKPLIDISSSVESCPPTRKACESQQLAAGFSGGLHSQGSAEEPAGLDGTISRRYTNMCTAAGAFEELVDDDGDVLSASESESTVADNGSRAPTISFSGMLSGVPADCEQQYNAPKPANGMRWQSMGPQNPHSSMGMMPATVDTMGISGVLPSDLCSEPSDGGNQNPLSMDSGDKGDAMRQFYLNAGAAHESKAPHMLGQWFDDTLGDERSERSLRLMESRTGSLNPPSSRRAAMVESMPVTAEHSTLSCTLSAALSIRTPRKVLQKFSPDDSDHMSTVLSTQEAAGLVASMQFSKKDIDPKDTGFRTSDSANVPRVLPKQLQVALPLEKESSANDYAVLTPQEWLNKVSKNFPSLPTTHLQLNATAGKAMAVSPVDAMSSRLGAFRPEEESLL